MHGQTPSSRADAVRLFFLGATTLFLELVFIRYLAGNIWNLGYFPNLVLMSVFIGMGLGFGVNRLLTEKRSDMVFYGVWSAILLLAALLYTARPQLPFFQTTTAGTVGGELFFSANRPFDTGYFYFVAVFFGVLGIFTMISQRTARLFCRFSPLRAYTLDIAGSCLGIVAFMGVSFFALPAWSWFLIAAAMTLFTLPRLPHAVWAVLLPGLATAGIAYAQDRLPLVTQMRTYMTPNNVWSPYQKVGSGVHSKEPHVALLFVNGVSHQDIMSTSALPESFYMRPHISRREAGRTPYENVLIIGAGSGNDVAAAVNSGAKHVDAVEIDPVIADVGRRLNPHQVYQDPTVKLTVDDGRAFMTRTDRRYDLIVFALTDSLVRVSAVAQLRLENYLFTLQSVRRAYELLRPGGDLILYNYYRYPWLSEKIQGMLKAATGKSPEIIYQKEDFVMLRVTKSDDAPLPSPGDTRVRAEGYDIPTDDWPFLYLQHRGIPSLYLKATGLLMGVVVFLFLLLEAAPGGALRRRTPGLLPTGIAFFLMGVAFLLLETKSIIQFSLLFGTTWLNNSLVFLAVLLLVLAANWVASRLPKGVGLLSFLFVLLLVSCLVGLVYPLGNLLGIASPTLRFVLASLLTFSPIFFANLIFSVTFRDKHEVSDRLFGWNLLGATLGGALEYTSMELGYNYLAVVVAVTYSLVFVLLLTGRHLSPARQEAVTR